MQGRYEGSDDMSVSACGDECVWGLLEFGGDFLHESIDHGGVSVEESGSDGVFCACSDDAWGRVIEVHPWQFGGGLREDIAREFESGTNDAAEVRVVRVDDVESGSGSDVDNDSQPVVEANGGFCIGDTVSTDGMRQGDRGADGDVESWGVMGDEEWFFFESGVEGLDEDVEDFWDDASDGDTGYVENIDVVESEEA